MSIIGKATRRPAGQALEKALSLSKNAPEKERLKIEAYYAEDIEKNLAKWAAIVQELVAKYPKEKDSHVFSPSTMNSPTRKKPSRNTTSP